MRCAVYLLAAVLPIAEANQGKKPAPGGAPEPTALKVYQPLRFVRWNMAPEQTYQLLNQLSSVTFEKLARVDSASGDSVILMTGTHLLVGPPSSSWQSRADIVFFIKDNRLGKILCTFKKPTTLDKAVADFEKTFGQPLEKKLSGQKAVSRIRWQVAQPASVLEIVMTENDGMLTITYEQQSVEQKAK